MPTLQCLLYASRATFSTSSLSGIATLMAEAQRNNARNELTGALAVHAGRFVQVLEGPAAALDRLMQRLQVDARHTEIQVLSRTAIDSRAFGDWSMASARITPELAPLLERVNEGGPAEQMIAALKTTVLAA